MRCWAIWLWIIVLKVIAVLVAVGSFWVFIELQRVAAEGTRELSFLGVVIGTDISIAIQLAPLLILIRGLLYSLALFAAAQFLDLLVDLMWTSLKRMKSGESHYQNVTPRAQDQDVWNERPPARQDDRAVRARAGGKWDMGSG